MSSDDMPYLIAEPPEHLQYDLVSWGFDKIKDSWLYDDDGYGRELYSHITFLSNIQPNKKHDAIEAVQSCRSVSCLLGEVKTFTTNSKFDVVYVEVISQEILALHSKLSLEIIHEPLFPKFLPHITIAYVHKTLGETLRGDRYFYGHQFAINELVISYDHGKSQERVRMKK